MENVQMSKTFFIELGPIVRLNWRAFRNRNGHFYKVNLFIPLSLQPMGGKKTMNS